MIKKAVALSNERVEIELLCVLLSVVADREFKVQLHGLYGCHDLFVIN